MRQALKGKKRYVSDDAKMQLLTQLDGGFDRVEAKLLGWLEGKLDDGLGQGRRAR